MKYKPGAIVVITNVPEKAAQFGVVVGMPAMIESIDHPGYKNLADDCGLTLVRIGMFTFWWNEDDLGLHQ